MASSTAPDPRSSEPIPPPSTEPSPMPEAFEEPLVGDVLELLLREKGVLAASAVLCGLLGWAYTAAVEPLYQTKASILMPQTHSGGASSIAASLGLSGLGGGGDNLSMFRKILESNTVTNAVSRQTGVGKGDLRKYVVIDTDGGTSTIDLTVVDHSKVRGLRVAKAYIRQLGVENTRLSLPGKSRKAQQVGAALQTQEGRLAAAENRLKGFVTTAVTAPGLPAESGSAPVFRYQDQLTTLTMQLDKLDTQLRQIDAKSNEAGRVQALDFPPVANWRSKLDDLAAKLAEARARYSEDSAEVRQAKREYDRVDGLLRQDIAKYLGAVERRVTGNVSQLDQDRTAVVGQIAAIRRLADAAPRESLEYQRLSREVGTLNTLVSQLRVDYEQAKLESADDPSRWEILDPPSAEDGPINKKFSRNVALAALGGLFVGMPFALRRARRRLRRGLSP